MGTLWLAIGDILDIVIVIRQGISDAAF